MTYAENIQLLGSYLEWIQDKDQLKDDLLIKYYQVDYFLRNFPLANDVKPIDYFRRALLNRNLAVYDLWNFKSLHDNDCLEIRNRPASQGPKIYCAFHFGSYRSIGCVLFQSGVKFSVVASASILNDKSSFLEPLQEFAATTGQDHQFEMINANENSAIVQMIRCLRENRSLLIYIDGTNGLGDFNIDREKLITVNFANELILSRQGVAFLSQRLNVPIVPVVSWRSESFERVYVEFFDEIIPDRGQDDFIRTATQSIWHTFSKVFSRHPYQWECVFYSSAFIMSKRVTQKVASTIKSDENLYVFNNAMYDFYRSESGHYLYCFNNSELIQIPVDLFHLLNELHVDGLSFTWSELRELLSEFTIENLVEKQILIGHA